MQMPEPIQNYFDADRRSDAEALVVPFAQDALVKDEGASYRGADEIGAWWRDAKQQYDHRAEPFEVTAAAGRVRIRAKVSGKFPGSPATLTYYFRLEGDRIAELEIGA
jgi:ketosteroid isomerase-like protein